MSPTDGSSATTDDATAGRQGPDRPTPAALARGGKPPAGVTVTLSDGQEWTLPHAVTSPALDAIRDRLYDDCAYSGSVAVLDVKAAAWMLLRASYHLDQGQAAALLAVGDTAALTAAVCACLIEDPGRTRTYSGWVRSALLANGLDPAKVPPADVPDVLTQLVATGRAAPPDVFVSSAAYERKRAEILGMSA